jgi:hypothetical protein
MQVSPTPKPCRCQKCRTETSVLTLVHNRWLCCSCIANWPSKMSDTDQDPTENFYLQLEVAKMQAAEKRFADAYQTLAAVYENLIEQYDEAIDEVIKLRKKVSDL